MREPLLMIATGAQGVGKSFETNKVIKDYLRRHGQRRKVLIFDVNNEDTYLKYKTVFFDVEEVQRAKRKEKKTLTRVLTRSERNIQQLPPGQIRRIAPFTRNGIPMNVTQKRLTYECIMESFRAGLILLEDVNKYVNSFSDDRSQAAFKAIRHNSQDIIIHLQSTQPLRPLLLEAATVFRMHFDTTSIDKMQKRLSSHFEIMKLAKIVVKDQYMQQKNERFFCYIYHKKNKLVGITPAQFQFAAQHYLAHFSEPIEKAAKVAAIQEGRFRINDKDRLSAMNQWIKHHQQLYLS